MKNSKTVPAAGPRGFAAWLLAILENFGKRYAARLERQYMPLARAFLQLNQLLAFFSAGKSAAALPAAAPGKAPTFELAAKVLPVAEPEDLAAVVIESEDDWFARQEREKLLALKAGVLAKKT